MFSSLFVVPVCWKVDSKTGKLNVDKVADTLANIEKAATMYNGTKQVFCSFWAGTLFVL